MGVVFSTVKRVRAALAGVAAKEHAAKAKAVASNWVFMIPPRDFSKA
jgi:predicted oxidoreductase